MTPHRHSNRQSSRHNNRQSSRRAFTMLELAVALAALATIALVAITLFSTYVFIMRRAREAAQLNGQARASLDYVVEEAHHAGSLLPEGGTAIIEDNCASRGGFPACNGTDRVTFIQPNPGYRVCRVTSEPLAGVIDVKMRTKKRHPGDPPVTPECCLQTASFRRQAAFVTADGAVVPVLITSNAGTAATCKFDYTRIYPVAFASLTNAAIVLADVKTFYVDFPATAGAPGKLAVQMELDGNTASIAGERLFLADGIADFQIGRAGTVTSDVTEPRLIFSLVAAVKNPARGVNTSPATRLSSSHAMDQTYIFSEATAEFVLRPGG